MEEKLVNIMNEMAEYLNISQLAVRIDEKLHLFMSMKTVFEYPLPTASHRRSLSLFNLTVNTVS